MRLQPAADQENAAYAGELFQYLGQSGYAGPFNAIEIAVDQRVCGTERDRERKNTEKRSAAFFHEKGCCNPIGILIDQPCTGKGKGHGDQETCQKYPQRGPVIVGCRFRSSKFRDSGLYACCG